MERFKKQNKTKKTKQNKKKTGAKEGQTISGLAKRN